MAEGRTHSVEGEGDGVEHDSVRYQFGVGRGLSIEPLESRTPGPSVTALRTPRFTSTRCVKPSRAEPRLRHTHYTVS